MVYSDEILVSKTDVEEKNTLMSELKTRVEELKMANEYQLRLKDMCDVDLVHPASADLLFLSRNYNEKIKDLTDKFSHDAEVMKAQVQGLSLEKDKEEARHDHEIGEFMDR